MGYGPNGMSNKRDYNKKVHKGSKQLIMGGKEGKLLESNWVLVSMDFQYSACFGGSRLNYSGYES